MTEKIKKICLFAFFLLIFFRPVQVIFQQKETFFGKGYHDQYPVLKKLYYRSQYVTKKNPSIIPDEALEAFAAGAFLKGINPILIIHDQPPLGRYLLAFSIALFDNPNTILLFLFIASVTGVYLVAKKIISNTFVSLIPVAIFANEPLFLHKFVYIPLLEPLQLPFVIFAIYFFLKAIEEKKDLQWFFLTWVMIGFVISTRFFILGGALFSSLLVFFILQREWKKLKRFLLFSPISVCILVASYAKTIQYGASIIHIIGIQKYIFFYHQKQLSLPFSFWDLLLFNRWHTWWGSYAITTDTEWIVFWPVATFLVFLFIVAAISKKVAYARYELVIFLWVLFYSLLLSTGNTSTRYFLPLLPFIYILATSFIFHVLQKKKR